RCMGCGANEASMILQGIESPTVAWMRSVFGHERPLIVKTMRVAARRAFAGVTVSTYAVDAESRVAMMTNTRSRIGAVVAVVSTTNAPASNPLTSVSLAARPGVVPRYT